MNINNELKTKFIAQQTVIREAEIKLGNDTQILLTEMLRSMSEEDLKNLGDSNIELEHHEYCNTITKIIVTDTHISFETEDYMDDTSIISIDDLSQLQQKELIDFILKD